MRMFKFRRSALVQQLWKHVLEEAGGPHDEAEDRRSTSSSVQLIPASKNKQIRAMLMRLKEASLENLLKAVRTKGADPGGCVLMPLKAGSNGCVAAHVLVAQLFRWPDLVSEAQLKRLSFCHESHDLSEKCHQDFKHRPRLYECCNPYHWSRLVNHVTSHRESLFCSSQVFLGRDLAAPKTLSLCTHYSLLA